KHDLPEGTRRSQQPNDATSCKAVRTAAGKGQELAAIRALERLGNMLGMFCPKERTKAELTAEASVCERHALLRRFHACWHQSGGGSVRPTSSFESQWNHGGPLDLSS